MKPKRILVVDDEHDLCDILLFNLRAAGYEAHAAHSAYEALAANPTSFDLMLLDVMMPAMSGFELASHLRANATQHVPPIIFLTAKDSEDDTLRGFELGADDYVTKPFSVRELMARVKAVLARNTTAAHTPQQTIEHQALRLDMQRKTATLNEENIALTKTEFELLALLMSHPRQVFSRRQLLESVWPENVVVTERTVDVNLARLRKKIGPYSACITARQGFGYIFEP